jgi:hypothetical protein
MSEDTEIKTDGEGGDKGGSEDKGWLTSIPENLRDNEVIKGLEKPSEGWEKLVDLSEKVKGMVEIPGDEATDEKRAEFYTRMGRPESPDGYELQKPDLPEGLGYSADAEKAYREAAHKLGMSNAQVKALYDWYNETTIGGYETRAKAQKAEQEKTVEALKKEWGKDFDKNSEIAVRAAEKFGGDDFKKFLEETRLGDNPHFVRVFHAIGTAIADDSSIPGSTGSGAEKTEEEIAKSRFPKTYKK